MSSISRRKLFTRWLERPARAEKKLTPAVRRMLPDFLRPPGAAPEASFLELCERCPDCREACPHDAILPMGPAYGDGEGTPVILPRGRPCHLCEDLPCARACPSGALKPLPVAEVRMGTARLDPSRCLSVKGQSCDDCLKECPLGERALRWNSDRPEIVEETCTGCGMCVHICAADPGALTVKPSVG
jgi:ferredoxin-type protein NapG